MRFLLDENTHIKLIRWLHEKGHDVTKVPSDMKNGKVFGLSQEEGRILITRDKDFADRLQYKPNPMSGIIVLRVHPPKLDKLIAALESVLSQYKEDQIVGKIIIADERNCQFL